MQPAFAGHFAGMLEHVCGNCQVMDGAIAWVREFQDKEFIKTGLDIRCRRPRTRDNSFSAPASGPAFDFNAKGDSTFFKPLFDAKITLEVLQHPLNKGCFILIDGG